MKDVDGRLEGGEAQIEELERRLAEEEGRGGGGVRRRRRRRPQRRRKRSPRGKLPTEDKAEEEFDKMERKFLIKLGLVEPNEDELEEGA